MSKTFRLGRDALKQADQTHKSSDSFPFDDLRLWVTLREDPSVPPTDLAGVLFEVQIKTFLQHAWSIATHDLLYKTDDVNWSKARIAYQIKAMLEHAEVSIQEADSLAACATLAKEDRKTTEIKEAIKLVKSQWSHDELPADIRGLATNIITLAQALRLEIERFEEILNDGKARGAGVHPANLSPYGTLVQYLLVSEKDKMVAFLKSGDGRTRTNILISDEIELPADVRRAELAHAVFVSERR